MLPLLNDCRKTLLLSLDQWIGVTECWEVCLALAKRLTAWVAMETPGKINYFFLIILLYSVEWNKVSMTVRDDDNVAMVTTGDDNEDRNEDMTRENVGIGKISQFFLEYHEKKDDIPASQEDYPQTDDADATGYLLV